ncbi:hypothetical protein ACTWJ8_40640 (plasmid) [Streptomyces sp. SDT5-1]|uniref:hypothetical protein n=1 Tax=Streptomyces sp. SDT5-1 TaxID=3406418 RepID=UPI003FD52DD1
MFNRDQIADARAQITGESLLGVRQRLAERDRFAELLPEASREQAELEAVLLDALGQLPDASRPLGIREAIPGADSLELRLESMDAVRALLRLLPWRNGKQPWQGVRQLTGVPDGRSLRFQLRTRRERRYPNEQPGDPHVRVWGPHGADIAALLAAHAEHVTAEGGTPFWDPEVSEPALTRREPLDRDVLRQLAPGTGLASLLLRRPRLWDSLLGYTGVQVKREQTDYGLDWTVERPVTTDPHDQRLLAAWSDEVAGAGVGLLDHFCDQDHCRIQMSNPRQSGQPGATLTIHSRRLQAPAGHTPHAARPLGMLGEDFGHSRPARTSHTRAQAGRDGMVIALVPPSDRSSFTDDLSWTAEQIGAVWAAQGLKVALVVISRDHGVDVDFALMRRRRQGEWPTETVPRSPARWTRRRLAPAPGGLWHLHVDSDAALEDVLAAARRDFDRVLITERADWMLRLSQISHHIDRQVVALAAGEFVRSIPLPAAAHDPEHPLTMPLTPRESALQWRQEHLGAWDAGRALAGLLLLHSPRQSCAERVVDDFTEAVEEHLALMGTPVLAHFTTCSQYTLGPRHWAFPPTVLDPDRADAEAGVPRHADMEKGATDFAKALKGMPSGGVARSPHVQRTAASGA